MSKQEMTVKSGFTPIPIGAVVRIIKSDHSWMLRGLWQVTGYENYDRNDLEIGPITQLHLKSWTTERFFCYSKEFPWCVEVVDASDPRTDQGDNPNGS